MWLDNQKHNDSKDFAMTWYQNKDNEDLFGTDGDWTPPKEEAPKERVYSDNLSKDATEVARCGPGNSNVLADSTPDKDFVKNMIKKTVKDRKKNDEWVDKE